MTPATSRRPLASVPTLDWERAFWRAELRFVAGVDEVGRGALAGPLVAAAVVLPCCRGVALRRLRSVLAQVRDSKLVPPVQRIGLMNVISEVATAVAIGVVEADELDVVGVGAANRLAMERAVRRLPIEPDVLLLDACVLDLALPQVGAIDADAVCLSVAAASIVAKVTRDRVMVDADNDDPRYRFAEHKGYGTATHLRALREHGPGPLHRRCFAPVAAAARVDAR